MTCRNGCPEAAAIVNPKLLRLTAKGQHALRDLPGVGVAYKLAEALYDWAGRDGEAEKHLDLAALGIIADLAMLRGDTRYLPQRGLAALRAPQRLGLQVLAGVGRARPGQPDRGAHRVRAGAAAQRGGPAGGRERSASSC